MAHPYDEYADIKFSQWAALGVKLGGRAMVDLALRDEVKFVHKGNDIVIEPKPKIITVPGIEVPFELTLKAPIQGLRLLELFGCDTQGWDYKGPVMTGPLTRKFMLVSVGKSSYLPTVICRLTAWPNETQGQWLEAFRRAYPQNDGQGPIGVADPSWIVLHTANGDNQKYFPRLLPAARGWDPYFSYLSLNDEVEWRWLIELK